MPVKTATSPEIVTIHRSEKFYTLLINGNTGHQLDPHVCSEEAFLFVHYGNILLTVDEESHRLISGNYFTIPAHKVHSIRGESGFEVLLTISSTAQMRLIR